MKKYKFIVAIYLSITSLSLIIPSVQAAENIKPLEINTVSTTRKLYNHVVVIKKGNHIPDKWYFNNGVMHGNLKLSSWEDKVEDPKVKGYRCIYSGNVVPVKQSPIKSLKQ